MANRLKVTQEKKDKFLAALAQTGNVSLACRSIAIVNRTIYEHRAKDPAFREAWDDALEEFADRVEAEIVRRGLAGYEKPIVYQGKVTGTVTEKSDTLLIFLAKALRPEKFRENYDMGKLLSEFVAGRVASVPQPARGAAKGVRGRKPADS